VRHDVTPVASGVADGDKDGFAFIPCPAERSLSPRVPIDGIFGMLQQIGTFFENQAIVTLTSVGGEGAKVDSGKPGDRILPVMRQRFHQIVLSGTLQQ
jgi:hypothetical protein